MISLREEPVLISRRRMALLAIAATVPWLLLGGLWLSRREPRVVSPSLASNAPSIAGSSHSGPWGSLTTTTLVIGPPLEYIDRLDETRVGNPWTFEGFDEAKLAAFLKESDVPQPHIDRILAAARPLDPPAVGVVVAPDDDVVWALSPTSRAKIYNRLGFDPVNRDQANAFRFQGKSLDEWLEDADLSSETIDLLRPLVYRNGPFLFFADFARVMAKIADDDERDRLAKALARCATFGMRLSVKPGEDIDDLVHYWGRGGRENEIRPLLESLARGYWGGSTDVSRLLPQFVRENLFVYSPPTSDKVFAGRDCHWAALNFFNPRPDDRFADGDQQTQEMATRYHPIYGNPQLGDLVLFVEGKETLIHTAVYIADGIVFTKNGASCTEPGMLIRIEDMKSYYPTAEPLRVMYRRRNDL